MRALKAGGKSLAKLLNGSKIYHNKVEVQKVKTQCEILRYQKRALEESVTEILREFQFHTVGCPFLSSFHS